MNNGLAEYRKKLDSGEIVRAKPLNPREKAKANAKSLRLAINANCFDCVGGSRTEVTRCEITDCPLWNVRPWQKNQAL